MSCEAIAIVGAAGGLLAVLVPLILTLHGRVVAEMIAEVRRSARRGAMSGTPATPATARPGVGAAR